MKLTQEFYERNTLEVAKELLGKQLVHTTLEGTTIGSIVEVEAYIGPEDKAAHSYNGKRTSRTEVMFGSGGIAYVYLIYGMYDCFNIVTNKINCPEAILIRALEPVEGIELMQKRRNTKKCMNLCSGPGKLCIAMGITRQNNGQSLTSETLFVSEGGSVSSFDIVASPRINIDYAGEAKDYLWRFSIQDNPFVSK